MTAATPALNRGMGVAVALSESWDALDFDFRSLGLNLAECCWGPDAIGVRRLLAFITRLPIDSQWSRERGYEDVSSRQMQATLVQLMHATYDAAATTAAAMTSGKYRGPKKPFEWPKPSIGYAEPLTREGIRRTLMGR